MVFIKLLIGEKRQLRTVKHKGGHMTGYKKQSNDSIHDPIPLTFVEWMHQAHTEHNTALAEGWKEAFEARRERVREQIAQNAHERMTNPEEIDCNGDVTVYHSMLDDVPWEAEAHCSCGAILSSDAESISGECEDCMLSERSESGYLPEDEG